MSVKSIDINNFMFLEKEKINLAIPNGEVGSGLTIMANRYYHSRILVSKIFDSCYQNKMDSIVTAFLKLFFKNSYIRIDFNKARRPMHETLLRVETEDNNFFETSSKVGGCIKSSQKDNPFFLQDFYKEKFKYLKPETFFPDFILTPTQKKEVIKLMEKFIPTFKDFFMKEEYSFQNLEIFMHGERIKFNMFDNMGNEEVTCEICHNVYLLYLIIEIVLSSKDDFLFINHCKYFLDDKDISKFFEILLDFSRDKQIVFTSDQKEFSCLASQHNILTNIF